MGLDIYGPNNTHARKSYSGFHTYRQRLASYVLINLEDMQGFGGRRSWDDVDQALVPLLNHSDCDGELSPAECGQIAPKLWEIIRVWEIESALNHDGLDRNGDIEYSKNLAEAMMESIRTGHPILFA